MNHTDNDTDNECVLHKIDLENILNFAIIYADIIDTQYVYDTFHNSDFNTIDIFLKCNKIIKFNNMLIQIKDFSIKEFLALIHNIPFKYLFEHDYVTYECFLSLFIHNDTYILDKLCVDKFIALASIIQIFSITDNNNILIHYNIIDSCILLLKSNSFII
jgi:hypothetical protein